MAKVVFVGNGRCGSLPCDPPRNEKNQRENAINRMFSFGTIDRETIGDGNTRRRG